MPQSSPSARTEEAFRLALARLRHDPVQQHFSSDLAEAATDRWAQHYGLLDPPGAAERLQCIRCGSCAAHTYPTASAELVELGANLIAWLFLFDDRYGEARELPEMVQQFEYCEAVLNGAPSLSSDAFLRALGDLRARSIKLGATPAWLARFAESLGKYFNGCLLEFPYRLQNRPPTLAAYRQLRCLSIGIYPVLDLVELGAGAPSPAARFRLGELRFLAALLCAWVNDLYSHRKEVGDRDPLNLVSVLRRAHTLEVADAYQTAVDLYHADLDHFSARVEALLRAPDASEVDREIARGIAHWVHGNCAWTRTSGRYRSRVVSTPLRSLAPSS